MYMLNPAQILNDAIYISYKTYSWETYKFNYSSSSYGLFNFGMATGPSKESLWIQTG